MAHSVLSNLEQAIYTAFFQAADKNKRGYLSIEELASVTKMCGLNLTQGEIAAADKNKDGHLSIDELASVVKMCGMTLTQKELAETFIEMDLNCDWKITLDEFITGMHSLRPGKRRVAKLNRELTECDKGGMGFLSYRMISNIARDKSDITEKEIENTFKDLDASDLNKINYKQFINVLEKKITD
ncbi:hypothetical protein LOTGIDRAFT_233261 [Lottia gigantea]|uniref:EF-hand domain-containing protein n=1 Tax=Lottia gigantea TaxID=225164 RepID=V4AA59_LOTGI|nr:hypothetical protein LOTGIDRAFT_233261 [Lottia gigantea]ESO91950.1 hypothetical protein LOTGIDRAFT_233261 [Lottia gigantea]